VPGLRLVRRLAGLPPQQLTPPAGTPRCARPGNGGVRVAPALLRDGRPDDQLASAHDVPPSRRDRRLSHRRANVPGTCWPTMLLLRGAHRGVIVDETQDLCSRVERLLGVDAPTPSTRAEGRYRRGAMSSAMSSSTAAMPRNSAAPGPAGCGCPTSCALGSRRWVCSSGLARDSARACYLAAATARLAAPCAWPVPAPPARRTAGPCACPRAPGRAGPQPTTRRQCAPGLVPGPARPGRAPAVVVPAGGPLNGGARAARGAAALLRGPADGPAVGSAHSRGAC
jgi:hypothetical protein